MSTDTISQMDWREEYGGRRGTFDTMAYLDPESVQLTFELQLAEMIVGFYDRPRDHQGGAYEARWRR